MCVSCAPDGGEEKKYRRFGTTRESPPCESAKDYDSPSNLQSSASPTPIAVSLVLLRQPLPNTLLDLVEDATHATLVLLIQRVLRSTNHMKRQLQRRIITPALMTPPSAAGPPRSRCSFFFLPQGTKDNSCVLLWQITLGQALWPLNKAHVLCNRQQEVNTLCRRCGDK
jgi:hypothetical protein